MKPPARNPLSVVYTSGGASHGIVGVYSHFSGMIQTRGKRIRRTSESREYQTPELDRGSEEDKQVVNIWIPNI